jgi:hypothetical protein
VREDILGPFTYFSQKRCVHDVRERYILSG